jgi:hypothetical protein
MIESAEQNKWAVDQECVLVSIMHPLMGVRIFE